MGNFFSTLDSSVFYLINRDMKNFLLDAFLPLFARHEDWALVAVTALSIMLYCNVRKGLPVLILSIIAVIISDVTIHNFIKPYFERVRPCNVLPPGSFNIMMGCGGSYSLPSQHASNSFAIASVIGYKYRKAAPALLFLAFSVALSRVYVGVHYPFDITTGALYGMLCATLVLLTDKKYGGSDYLAAKMKKMNDIEVLIRLILAVPLGGMIGYEREIQNQPAGLRTHIVLCVGSTLIRNPQRLFQKLRRL